MAARWCSATCRAREFNPPIRTARWKTAAACKQFDCHAAPTTPARARCARCTAATAGPTRCTRLRPRHANRRVAGAVAPGGLAPPCWRSVAQRPPQRGAQELGGDARVAIWFCCCRRPAEPLTAMVGVDGGGAQRLLNEDGAASPAPRRPQPGAGAGRQGIWRRLSWSRGPASASRARRAAAAGALDGLVFTVDIDAADGNGRKQSGGPQPATPSPTPVTSARRPRLMLVARPGK